MKLIGMTDFVLEQIKKLKSSEINILQFRNSIENYAKFLKQPLELWMFVPCAVDGEVLEKPQKFDFFLKHKYQSYDIRTGYKLDEYLKAKERCLFDFHIKNAHHEILFHNDTIEDLVGNGFILTPTAIKKIGL
jgi:hypothetical protein